MIVGFTWLELFPLTGRKHQVILISEQRSYKVSESHSPLENLISFLLKTRPAPCPLRRGSWNADRRGLQVRTPSAPGLDASTRAANRRRGTAQEAEASLWSCPGWRERRGGAASVASTLQADDAP